MPILNIIVIYYYHYYHYYYYLRGFIQAPFGGVNFLPNFGKSPSRFFFVRSDGRPIQCLNPADKVKPL